MYLMGIDIGTSSAKTAIFDEKGNMISLSASSYNPNSMKPGYAEQDPDIWWNAVQKTIKESVLKANISSNEIKAIGFSGQMHGLVPLDAENKVVRKAILHCDVRAKDVADDLSNAFRNEQISDIIMNPIFPGFQLVSLCWMRKYEYELFKKIKTVISPKDYVRYRLTGKIGVEHTDASATLLYDMQKENWSKTIFEKLDLDEDLVPKKIYNSYDIAGTVSAEAAALTGLSTNTVVVYGGADQAMHSLGNGVYKSGVMTATIGTGGQVLLVSEKPVFNSELNTHTFRHVKSHTWYGLGAVLHAGSTLNWFRRNFAKEYDYNELSEMASSISPCSEGLVFFPCMGGERTPYLDPEARGMFSGMSMHHQKRHFVRAIMEGVTFAMKMSIEKMNEIYGRADKLICAGGGVKSRIWTRLQADIYGRDIYISNISEQACLGAAIVASVGCGMFNDIETACEAMIQNAYLRIEPNWENVEVYEKFYFDVYSKLYKQNKDIFHKMNF